MKHPTRWVFILSFLLSLQASLSYSQEKTSHTSPDNKSTIILGYKEGSKPPYIGNKNDNSGAYRELFSKAAEMIGLSLEIVRLPKKRVYHHLKEGDIDFYPSSGFSEKRSQFLYWLDNGFLSKQALVSDITDFEIKDFKKAKGTLLVPLGSSSAEYAKGAPQVSIQKMGKLPIDKAIQALKLGRGNFYVYDIDILDYYLKRNRIKQFSDIGLRLHPNAIEKEYSSLKAAFSINSKHFKQQQNSRFDKNSALGFNNQKTSPHKGSVAYQFQQALKHLQESGYTQTVYQKYFK